MRTIKFRGKTTMSHSWVYGYLANEGVIDTGNGIAGVNPDTIGQFTGMYADGKEIYEGDIISVYGYSGCVKIVGWDENVAAFGLMNIDDLKCDWMVCDWQHPNKDWWSEYKIQIIGNIHDNPELLEQCKQHQRFETISDEWSPRKTVVSLQDYEHY